MEFTGKRIVLGVTGGVAAYKAAELTRLLVKAGAAVDVVMTAASQEFVGATTFQALSGRAVWSDLWDARAANAMSHIDLTRAAAACLVAPATANFIAKVAQGLADDLLSTLCLARACPLFVAPAMNRQMWLNPATQRNLAQIQGDGVGVLGPASGEMACGEVGEGRMLEPEELMAELAAAFQPKFLTGVKVLLTAGPTFEALDAVRGLTNLSSGRMGFALARAFAEVGAAVTLVAGPCALPTPLHVRRIDVISAQQMFNAVMQAVPGQQIFVGVAAVADYRPAQTTRDKIKKTAAPATLELTPNADILAAVAARPDAPFCVGFAAESANLAEYSEGKRRNKKLDLVVGNLLTDALGREDNRVTLFDAEGAHPLAAADKLTVARQIVRHVADLLARDLSYSGKKTHNNSISD